MEPNFIPEPDWLKPALEYINRELRANPPTLPEPLIRQEALMALDGPLHIIDAPRYRSTFEFYSSRMATAIAEMAETQVSEGAMVWKLYDHGFVVRTPSVTIGYDIVRGYYAPDWTLRAVSTELVLQLLDQLNVLLISHTHGDHADQAMVQLMLAMHKKVLVPLRLWPELDDNPYLLRPARPDWIAPECAADPELHAVHDLDLGPGKHVRLAVYPGHQGELLNNGYLVLTDEGLCFLHLGDQDHSQDLLWLDHIGTYHAVDILFPNCWTREMERTARGINPCLIIPGHENEISHEPSHRESNWASYKAFRWWQKKYPYVMMTWGERFHYTRALAEMAAKLPWE